MEGGSGAYHICGGLRLHGDLDAVALRGALDRIVFRHEVLRSRIEQMDGEPVQRVGEGGFALVEQTGSEAEAELWRDEESRTLFDLGRGPLIRGRLVRHGERDHTLLLTMHHIVSDGWSMGVLTRELELLYAAFRAGLADPLPPLPVQYGDYAVWQRRRMAGAALELQAGYWKQALAGAPALLDLPLDRPRPASQSYAGAFAPVELDRALGAALRGLARQHDTTLFMVLLAGWAVLLGRLSGQQDVVIGTPVANRTRAELEHLIGFFVNTLPLRLDLSGSPSVGDLLAQTRRCVLEGQQHQDIPFEQMVEAIGPPRSLAHSPVFQTMFAWQNGGGPALQFAGLEVHGVAAAEHRVSKFDLSLSLEEAADGAIRGGIEYATALFEPETVTRWLGYYKRLLEAMAAGSQQPVDRLPMLSAAEREQVLYGWNGARRGAAEPILGPRLEPICVHRLFEAQAARTPEAEAVVYAGASLNYAELNRRANRLAHWLREQGVGPDIRVGLCLERGLEMVVSLLAVLKAGGAYVPLDPRYPAARLRFMLEDSDPRLVLSSLSLLPLLDGVTTQVTTQAGTHITTQAGTQVRTQVRTVALDDDNNDNGNGDGTNGNGNGTNDDGGRPWDRQPDTNPDNPELTPKHLAYIIYTSGSTGSPKGVMVPHQGLANLAAEQISHFQITPQSRILQFASFSFDASVSEVFMAFCCGALLVLVTGEIDELSAELISNEISHVTLPPVVLGAFTELAELSSLKTVISAGEALPQATASCWSKARRLINAYGPTENTVCATIHLYIDSDSAGLSVPIGSPIGGVSVYVLDEYGSPVPAGVRGELYIGGTGVTRGYLKRAGLTAERFVPDPFGPIAGARLYRTGDVGYWRSDGELVFTGRTDSQVKVRGFRIEPGEVEARLREASGVAEAVVVADGDRLVAYYTSPGPLRADALRGHLQSRLPEYMVPGSYVHLEALPLTPNGKLDLKRLPRPEAEAEAVYEPPEGELETLLAGLWKDLLGAGQVGRHDNFFELGGHSLSATQLVSRVRGALGVELSLRSLFENPTVRGLAQLAVQGSAGREPVQAGPRPAHLPLSYAQSRLWFLDQMRGESMEYNMPFGLRLRGPLDPASLERAIATIVDRHESLRTCFTTVDGEPVQMIAPGLEVRLEPEPGPVAAVMRREGSHRFDLAHGPVFRAALVRVEEEEHVLFLTFHHIVSDAWSQGVFNRELMALYAAYRQGRPDPLPPLQVQYADFALWQRRQIEAGDLLERQLAYWKRQLAGIPEQVELPADRPRPAEQTFGAAACGAALSALQTAALHRLGRSRQATLYMTLLSAFAVLLARYSGQQTIVVGSPIANRQQAELEDLIGFFVNALVLRMEVDPSMSFAALLDQVRRTTLDAYQHQDVPFEKLVEELAPRRRPDATPLFQIVFALQNAPLAPQQLHGLSVEPVPDHDLRVRFDLELHAWEQDGSLNLYWLYNRDLFDAWRVEQMQRHFVRILEQVCDSPQQAVGEIGLLSWQERKLLLEDWNATRHDFPDTCVHHLFEQQARVRPDALAVVQGAHSLTYRQLNQRAGRIAHRLRGLGVGPDARVAICIERSVGMMVAVLAVLKAGGAYVPIDPAYPAERVAFMLEDCAPTVLLTDRDLAADRNLVPGPIPVLNLEEDIGTEEDTEPAQTDGGQIDPQVPELTPQHLAYVIYTSGSTGRPKGVMVQHKGLSNLVRWFWDASQMKSSDRLSSVASSSFDASVIELIPPLCLGAAVILPNKENSRDPDSLLNWWIKQDIDVSFLPTPVASYALLNNRLNRKLRVLIVGGDRMSHGSICDTPFDVINVYGPTETTVISTSGRVDAGAVLPSIGGPIWNTGVYVLDGFGSPVPVGVSGELYIGGAGVARGYLWQPGLTASCFVPDPFSGEGGSRMYRTGDLARWRPDGTMDFLGRNDFQVKVRGFRIEPGEIEARLLEQTGVRQAAVLAREDTPGDQRLVAYLVLEAELDGALAASPKSGLAAGPAAESMDQWQDLYETLYADSNREASQFNLAGWNSSYTRQPLPAVEMEEQIAATAERVLALAPERVLEIGCGTGLLLFRIAPHCRSYVGTDFSASAVATLRRQTAGLDLDQVRVEQRTAEDFDGLEPGSFDMVLVNSVVQYFPGIEYATRVIEGAVRMVSPGGCVLVGDVRNLALLEHFHQGVQRYRSSAPLTAEQHDQRAQAAMLHEKELLIHPEFFAALDLGQVDLQLRRGRFHNELTRYRYDALIHVGRDEIAGEETRLDWKLDGLDLDRLRTALDGTSSVLRVYSIPNARLTPGPGSVDPEQLWKLGQESGHLAEVAWSASAGADLQCTAVFRRQRPEYVPRASSSSLISPDGPPPSERRWANNPLRGRQSQALLAALPEQLRTKLPEHMVPGAYVLLSRLPLTPNGKLDRKALPAPEVWGTGQREFEAPEGELETLLASIWAGVLHLERVGRQDNFFELGGHSLLAVTLIERVRGAGVHLDVRTLFGTRTLAEFAAAATEAVEPPSATVPLLELSDAERAAIAAVVRGGAANIEDIYPLAPLQEGILFHSLLSEQGDPYLLVFQLRFAARERLDAYVRAMQAVIVRHDILRTGVFWRGLPEPVQVVLRDAPLHAEQVAADGPDVEQELWVRYSARHFRMDVEQAPLLRVYFAEDAVGAVRGRWVMMVLLHHLVGDHSTLEVLQQEMEAYLAGEEARLPRPLPFRRLVEQARQGVSREEHEAFFHRMLSDVDEPTVPFGLLERQSGEALAEARIPLDAALTRRIQQSARRLGVSAASVFHQAWAMVLARVSGRADVVFGTVLFGRMEGGEGSARAMGLFINTLPVRLQAGRLGAEASVLQTHNLLAELLRHEHASLVLAQRQSGVRSPRPLFTALLNYRHSTAVVAASRAWEGIELTRGEEGTNYPLTLSVDDFGDSFSLTAQADPSIEPERVCGLMSTAVGSLVEALECSPERPVRDIEVLSAAEREQVLYGWNGARRGGAEPAWEPACAHQLFEAQAARTPEAEAVVYAGQGLTYAELNRRANRLAHWLREQGVGPDVRVGLCLERGLEMVVSLLAVLKAGGAYVPLDPRYPAARLRFMLEDSDPRLVLSSLSLLPLLEGVTTHITTKAGTHITTQAGTQVRTVALDGNDNGTNDNGTNDNGDGDGTNGNGGRPWDRQPDTNPDAPELTPKHLAYIIYTSGSTGTPKGVMVPHHGLARLFHVTEPWFAFKSNDTFLLFHSFAFDFSVWEIWGALLYGGRLIIASTFETQSPADLYRLICRENVTVLSQTPSAFRQLIPTQSEQIHSLRCIIFGGEALDLSELTPWHIRGGNENVKLVNMYGITETTVHVTYKEIDNKTAKEGEGRSIGVPLPDLQTYILDQEGNPAPIGGPGELFVAGAGLARGYLKRAMLTAERFLPNPFSSEAGSRMYKSGDLACWRPDGNLEYLGRNDSQVKLRGFRIELGEIKVKLQEIEGIQDSLVIVRESGDGDPYLVAYVVDSKKRDSRLFRSYLESCLPSYMIPAAYIHLNRMPLTVNGKLDYKSLPIPDSDSYVREEFSSPQGETELNVSSIWREVLSHERIGRFDNFFDLGGHSLLAVKLAMRMQQQMGIELSISEIFAHPKLFDFAQVVKRLPVYELLPITKGSATASIPLSYSQRRLWFLSQMEGGSGAYHICGGLRLHGDLDAVALRGALDRIVFRHEVLRSRIEQMDGEPVQRVGEGGFALVEQTGSEAEAELWRDEESRTLFDLGRGPLIRGRLVRHGERDHTLLLTMHHIVSDGWSMGVLTRELELLYAAFRAGLADPLPPLPVQYGDYAVWQRRRMAGAALELQAGYWKQALADAPALLDLPLDHPRPASQSYAGAFAPFELDRALGPALRGLAKQHDATLFMVLLAGWAVLLGRLSGQQDVVIGTPVANRTRAELEHLIGFFVNTLPLRLDLSGSPSVGDLLAQTRRCVLEGQQHQDIPFEQMVEAIGPPRSLAHSPVFQTMFAWQNGGGPALQFAGLEVHGIAAAEHRVSKFDLSLSLEEAAEGAIHGGIEYATALFEPDTITRFLGYYKRLLEAMAAGSQQPVDRLPMLSAAEREQVLYGWNGARRGAAGPILEPICVHRLFEAQAARTPEAEAVVYAGQGLTYAELNRRANRLAHWLREQGVGPDVRVGLCLERGLEMVVSLLAVLKAGGAYVPLDPRYPAARLRFMLEDSDPRLVLSSLSLLPLLGDQAGTQVRTVALDDDNDHDNGTNGNGNGTNGNGNGNHNHNDNANRPWDRQPDTNPDNPELSPKHLAYIIYTSGSTGTPKGVMVPHHGLVNLAAEQISHFQITPQSRILQFASFSFDASVFEVFMALRNGAALVLQEAGVLTPSLRKNITHATLTPAVLSTFTDLEDLPQLDTVIAAGEQLPLAVAKEWNVKRLLFNAYGPTEATVWSTVHRCTSRDGEGLSVPIGSPIGGVSVYVLDEYGSPVPAGVRGELYIGGTGVTRGYLKRAGLTAERFVPDPFGPIAGARLYRTGDVGYWRSGGELVFTGRTDSQVKVRGFRIEPGEVEAALREASGVGEAVVTADGDRLVAYYTSPGPLRSDALRGHLQSRLPEYMVPGCYVHLEALPLTPNGKLDLKRLPRPEAEAETVYEPPEGELETLLAALWKDLLGAGQVGRNDNFFDLGGHSLSAVKLVMRIEEKLSLIVPVAHIFLDRNLKELALRLSHAVETEQRSITNSKNKLITATGLKGEKIASYDGGATWFDLKTGVEIR